MEIEKENLGLNDGGKTPEELKGGGNISNEGETIKEVKAKSGEDTSGGEKGGKGKKGWMKWVLGGVGGVLAILAVVLGMTGQFGGLFTGSIGQQQQQQQGGGGWQNCSLSFKEDGKDVSFADNSKTGPDFKINKDTVRNVVVSGNGCNLNNLSVTVLKKYLGGTQYEDISNGVNNYLTVNNNNNTLTIKTDGLEVGRYLFNFKDINVGYWFEVVDGQGGEQKQQGGEQQKQGEGGGQNCSLSFKEDGKDVSFAYNSKTGPEFKINKDTVRNVVVSGNGCNLNNLSVTVLKKYLGGTQYKDIDNGVNNYLKVNNNNTLTINTNGLEVGTYLFNFKDINVGYWFEVVEGQGGGQQQGEGQQQQGEGEQKQGEEQKQQGGGEQQSSGGTGGQTVNTKTSQSGGNAGSSGGTGGSSGGTGGSSGGTGGSSGGTGGSSGGTGGSSGGTGGSSAATGGSSAATGGSSAGTGGSSGGTGGSSAATGGSSAGTGGSSGGTGGSSGGTGGSSAATGGQTVNTKTSQSGGNAVNDSKKCNAESKVYDYPADSAACADLKKIVTWAPDLFRVSIPLTQIEPRTFTAITVKRAVDAVRVKNDIKASYQVYRSSVVKAMIESAEDYKKIMTYAESEKNDLENMIASKILRGFQLPDGKKRFSAKDPITQGQFMALFYQTLLSISDGKYRVSLSQVPAELKVPEREWLANACATGIDLEMLVAADCRLTEMNKVVSRDRLIELFGRLNPNKLAKAIKLGEKN